jgi:outer membrane protein assembly factor BamA
LKSTNVVGYVTIRPIERLAINYRVGWLDRPELLAPAGRFQRGNPPTQEVFPDDPTFALPEQPNYGYVERSLAYDTRDHRSHPTSGGIYRTAWTSYTDRTADTFSFERYEVEAAHFVPAAGSRVVLALRGWLVASDTADGKLVPFYLLPSLGGHNTLRAYTDYRFHDRNLLVVNVESRLALLTHVDAALFVDAGNVAARVSDLDLGKQAYGLGLRLHSRQTTFARFDIAHGGEGWRFLFRLSDPLHLSRLSRRTAAIPFVP